MDLMGVLPNFKGIAVHDFWSSYKKFKEVIHAINDLLLSAGKHRDLHPQVLSFLSNTGRRLFQPPSLNILPASHYSGIQNSSSQPACIRSSLFSHAVMPACASRASICFRHVS